MFSAHPDRKAAAIARLRLPAIYSGADFVEAGGLRSYGIDLAENFRLSAADVDKILRGARPGDLPVKQPTRFEWVINAKTAKALGLKIAPALLLQADDVID